MPRAELTIDFPPGIWIGDLSRTYPAAQFTVLSAFPKEDRGYGLLEITADDVEPVLADMRGMQGVSDVEVVQQQPDRAVVQFETTEFPLLVTIQRAQVPLELPLEVSDGVASLEFTAPHDRLSAFGDQLTALGISHRLERLYRAVEPADPLTEKQRELLVAALEHGYYDTPRETTLTALADELGMAPSTVSETLHRAEGAVIKTFLEDDRGARDADDD